MPCQLLRSWGHSHLKIRTMWFYHGAKCLKDADGMVNSVDPTQTAPLKSVDLDQTAPAV